MATKEIREILKQTGIYMITNTVNNKVYIGQTMASFGKRWLAHKRGLNKGIHGNKHLQRSWNKHGMSKFKFSILEIHNTFEDCNEAEERLISEYSATNREYGYNLSHGGNNHKKLEETIDKLKVSWTDKMKETTGRRSELFWLTHGNQPKFGDEYIELPCEINVCTKDQYKEWEDNGYTVFSVLPYFDRLLKFAVNDYEGIERISLPSYNSS